MSVPEVMRAIKLRAEQRLPQLREVFYPVPGTITKFPALVLLSGVPETMLEITHGSFQLWHGEVYGFVAIARQGDISREVVDIDELIAPVVDAFGTARDMAISDGFFDFCEIRRTRTNRLLDHAGHTYIGAEMFFAVKWRRSPGVWT